MPSSATFCTHIAAHRARQLYTTLPPSMPPHTTFPSALPFTCPQTSTSATGLTRTHSRTSSPLPASITIPLHTHTFTGTHFPFHPTYIHLDTLAPFPHTSSSLGCTVAPHHWCRCGKPHPTLPYLCHHPIAFAHTPTFPHTLFPCPSFWALQPSTIGPVHFLPLLSHFGLGHGAAAHTRHHRATRRASFPAGHTPPFGDFLPGAPPGGWDRTPPHATTRLPFLLPPPPPAAPTLPTHPLPHSVHVACTATTHTHLPCPTTTTLTSGSYHYMPHCLPSSMHGTCLFSPPPTFTLPLPHYHTAYPTTSLLPACHLPFPISHTCAVPKTHFTHTHTHFCPLVSLRISPLHTVCLHPTHLPCLAHLLCKTFTFDHLRSTHFVATLFTSSCLLPSCVQHLYDFLPHCYAAFLHTAIPYTVLLLG